MAYFHNNLPIFYYYGGSPYNTSGREFKMSEYNYKDSTLTNWYYAKAISDTYGSSISNLFNNASWGTQADTYYRNNGTSLPFTTRESSGLPIMKSSSPTRFSVLYATATHTMSSGNVKVVYVPSSSSCKVTFNTTSYTVKGDGIWVFLQAAGGGGGGGDNSYFGQGEPGGGGGASGGAAWVWLNAKKLYNLYAGAYFSIESSGWTSGGAAGSSGSGFTSGSSGASIYVYAVWSTKTALLTVPGGGGGEGMSWKAEGGSGGLIGAFAYNSSSTFFGANCLWATCLTGKNGGAGKRGSSGSAGDSYSGTYSLSPIWTSSFSLTNSVGYGTAPSVTSYGGGGGASIAGYNYNFYGYGGRGAQSATVLATAGGIAYCAVLSNTFSDFSAPTPGYSTTTSHYIYNNNDVACMMYYSVDGGITWSTTSISAGSYITATYSSGKFKGLFYITPASGTPGRCSDLATG